MSKTPVSILQELMVKKFLIPTYEVLPDSEGLGTHSPIFYCRAIADGITAIGKAGTKKEAKHQAARMVLEKLSERGYSNALPIESGSPVHLPASPLEPSSPVRIEINAIGILKDLCAEKQIPQPEFQLLSDVGPPHSRQFTIECTIGSMSATATDLTKKKAKQSAAHKMLQRLQDAMPEDIEDMIIVDPTYNDDEVIRVYRELSTQCNRNINWGMKIADYPLTIQKLMEEKDLTFKDLWQVDDKTNTLSQVLEKLDLHYSTDYFENKKVMAVTTLDTSPPFTFMARHANKQDALEDTLKQMLSFLKLLSYKK